MIVIDASAVVDLVLDDESGDRLGAVAGEHGEMFAPAHLPVECTSAVWRLVRADELDATAGDAVMHRMASVPITLLDTDPLVGPAWNLRHTFRVTDAFYVACAQSLSMPLLTTDARLARAAKSLGVATL